MTKAAKICATVRKSLNSVARSQLFSSARPTQIAIAAIIATTEETEQTQATVTATATATAMGARHHAENTTGRIYGKIVPKTGGTRTAAMTAHLTLPLLPTPPPKTPTAPGETPEEK